MEWKDIKTAPKSTSERWFFVMIGFWIGMIVMDIIKGDNIAAFWEGLTGG